MTFSHAQKDSHTCIYFEPPKCTESLKTNLKVAMCIDVSGSMGEDAKVKTDDGDQVNHGWSVLDVTKHSTNTFVKCLDAKDKVCCTTFTETAEVIVDWQDTDEENTESITQQLLEMKPLYATNYVAGLTKTFEQIQKDAKSNFDPSSVYIIVFFTDGLPSSQYYPVRGYEHFMNTAKKSLYKEVQFEFPLHICTVGLGNNLNSEILASMAPHGFLYLSDPGQIGPCMVNLVSHCKSIANYNNVPLIDPEVRVYPANAIKDTVAYKINERTDTYDSFKVGPILFDIPRHFIIETNDIKKIELFAHDKLIMSASTSDWKSRYDREVKRSNIVKTLFTYYAGAELTELTRIIESFPVNDSIRVTMTKEMIPGLLHKYDEWGQHFVKTLPPMLRDERRHSFADECVQEYVKDVDGKDSLFETICNDAELMFAKTRPPPPSNLRKRSNQTYGSTAAPPITPLTSLPDEFMRGGGCWAGHCRVIVKRNEKLSMMKTSQISKDDYVYNGKSFSKVICKVKRCISGEFAVENNLIITPFHPIKFYTDEWVHPKNCFQFFEHYSNMEVYDFVLEDTHIMCVENIPCITLAHNVQNDLVATHDYYGTQKVIADLKIKGGFETGYVEYGVVEYHN